MGQIQERRSVWYFSQSQGWIHEREPSDAKYRLTAVGRTQHHVRLENRLETRTPDGGWQVLAAEAESRLSAVERGLSFVIKPVQTERGSFMQIESKRFLDTEMLTSLYEGISLFDGYGEPMADPELAFDRVHVSRTQSDIFVDRVKTRGGQIVEARADLHAMYAALSTLEGVYGELGRVCERSRTAVEADTEALRSEAAALSERSQAVHHLRTQAVERVDFIRSEKMTLDQQSDAVEYRSYGAQYLENAEVWLSHIEKLHRDHRGYETQAISRLQDSIFRSLPAIDGRALVRRHLFIPVAEYYTELNQDCQLTEQGMMVKVGDATVHFGETATVSSPSIEAAGPPAADGLVGRGEREI